MNKKNIFSKCELFSSTRSKRILFLKVNKQKTRYQGNVILSFSIKHTFNDWNRSRVEWEKKFIETSGNPTAIEVI